ncbi:amino acid dehydrogenase [Bdellovibrio sp. qaytius]|nr:amino acid dehydrogenase [Bdellovibrio sp. qaytius]
MKKSITVIGGGIIGLSCAVKLAEAGADVVVIEKEQVGYGCSYGNAGWMTPCFSMPLPMPGMLLKSMKWMLNPSGPLYIKPVPSVLLTQWLTRFLLSMTEKKSQIAIEALVALSMKSLNDYKILAQEYPEIEMQQKGLLMVSATNEGVKAAVQELNLVEKYNVPGKILNAEQIKELEPALKGNLLGGVYFTNEAHAEPLKVVQALTKKALKLGVKILEHTEFQKANITTDGSNKKIKSILTSKGEILAEAFVLATGSWSQAIAAELNLNVPILGGKGYALIVDRLKSQPKIPIMILDRKIAITPRQDSLRIAGTLELVNQDFSITERRVKAIFDGAKEFLDIPESIKIHETWRGLRPCTPDGVPLIGWAKDYSNLMMACGHQMLGLQSGLGTGQLVSDLIVLGQSDLNRQVYDPARF